MVLITKILFYKTTKNEENNPEIHLHIQRPALLQLSGRLPP